MIYLDTDHLQSLILNLASANRQIDEAANLMLQITTHDGWGCAERHQINEHILENRKLIQQLQEKTANFHDVVKQVTDEFIETENGIGNLFGNLEAVLAKFMSIIQAANVNAVATDVIPNAIEVAQQWQINQTIASSVDVIDSLQNNPWIPNWGNSSSIPICRPISVVDFSNYSE